MKKAMIISLGILLNIIILCLYSAFYPKETLITGRHYYKSKAIKTDSIPFIDYNRYELTLVNAFNIRKVSVNPETYDQVKKWQRYTTEYDLYRY